MSDIRKLLKRTKDTISNKSKAAVASAFLLFSSQAMGQSLSSPKEDDNKKEDKVELKAKIPAYVEAEAMAGDAPVQSASLFAYPSLSVQNEKFMATLSSEMLFTNDTPADEQFNLYCTELKAKLAAKLGKGELTFTAGKIKSMVNNSAIMKGGSVGLNNYLVTQGVAGTVDNTVLVGYETDKGTIDIGYIGNSNEQGVTLLDFSKFSDGQAVLIGSFNPNESLALKVKLASDFNESTSGHLNATYKKNDFTSFAEYINNNNDSHLVVLGVKKEFQKDFSLLVEAIAKQSKEEPLSLDGLAAITHKSGVYGGVSYGKSGKSIRIGYTKFFANSKEK